MGEAAEKDIGALNDSRTPAGAPGPTEAQRAAITVITYDEARYERKTVKSAQECAAYGKGGKVTWINVDGVHDVTAWEAIAAQFGLHPLILEAISHQQQRPKLEDYDKYLFIVVKMLSYGEKSQRTEAEQLSIVLAGNVVITFQDRPGDVFEELREALETGKGRARKMGSDYLVYSLLDAVVDNYFTVCEKVGEKIEPLQEALIAAPSPKALREIQRLRREIIFVRRSVWPLREVIGGIEKTESRFFAEATQLYMRDLYDHTIQIMDTIETFRDTLSSTVDIYLSSVSNRLNEIMKVLTIIATIFIPLTFITSFYGMNFRYMPELSWRWGYPGVLLVMLVMAVGMLAYFRKRRWM